MTRLAETGLHDLPNHLPRIEHIWAYLSVDEGGSEGLCAAQMGDLTLPLIAADPARLEQLRPFVLAIAAKTSKRIVLARFTARVDEGLIDGRPS